MLKLLLKDMSFPFEDVIEWRVGLHIDKLFKHLFCIL